MHTLVSLVWLMAARRSSSLSCQQHWFLCREKVATLVINVYCILANPRRHPSFISLKQLRYMVARLLLEHTTQINNRWHLRITSVELGAKQSHLGRQTQHAHLVGLPALG